MSPKAKTIYVCTQCGCQAPKWVGRCSDCGGWNTMQEEVFTPTPAPKAPGSVQHSSARPPAELAALGEVSAGEEQRYTTGITEFDRVLGGGLVPGSVVLVCGDPGIGKSTLLLQICGRLAGRHSLLYVSGEESLRQIKLRANRLGLGQAELMLCAATDIEQVLEKVRTLKPDVLMIDSIQTMTNPEIASTAGSVSQVRSCTGLLTDLAKSIEMPTLIVGHVNKDGAIAGPKVLEHIVDTVLYFEGERSLTYRILRSMKNRYGSTNEIGVFEMSEKGLEVVDNPSLMLLQGRGEETSGSCVVALMEGSRPILAEVQALAAKTAFGAPRRMSTGLDYNRIAMLIAVLEKRCGFSFLQLDSYINVVGGLKIDDPAADLAVCLALVSNLLDKPLPQDLAAFGEIGLAGEVRAVGQAQQRMNEAFRLGFHTFVLPQHCLEKLNPADYPGAKLYGISSLSQALRLF